MSENKDLDQNINVETAVSEAGAASTSSSSSSSAAASASASSSAAGTEELQAEIERLKNELAQAQLKAEENFNLALRTKAEAENAQRRAEKDVTNAHKYALEKFAQDLMPIMDSMELGLNAAEDANATIEKFKEGSELTFKMFLSALEKHGIEVVNPQGEKFNPDFHQAMSMQENPDLEPNTVMGVLQKGYTIQGRLIRPAMVVVSKGGTAKPESSQIDEMA